MRHWHLYETPSANCHLPIGICLLASDFFRWRRRREWRRSKEGSAWRRQRRRLIVREKWRRRRQRKRRRQNAQGQRRKRQKRRQQCRHAGKQHGNESMKHHSFLDPLGDRRRQPISATPGMSPTRPALPLAHPPRLPHCPQENESNPGDHLKLIMSSLIPL